MNDTTDYRTAEKLLNMESMPAIKLGFTTMSLDDVNAINNYYCIIDSSSGICINVGRI